MSALVMSCVLRIALFRPYMQAFLESALTYGIFYLSTSKTEADAKKIYNTKVVLFSLRVAPYVESLGCCCLFSYLCGGFRDIRICYHFVASSCSSV